MPDRPNPQVQPCPTRPLPLPRSRPGQVLAAAAAALTLLGACGAKAANVPPGLPEGIPLAASRAEPVLPAPSAAVWPFGEAFPRTSGTGRLSAGAAFWSDFLFDDLGPGTYAYPFGSEAVHGQNGADIFRAAVGLRNGTSYWRVDWTTLLDAKTPIALWALDVDHNDATGGGALPAEAGATAPGFDWVLVMSGTAAYLWNASTQATIDVPLTVDMASRSFIAAIPASVLPVSDTWRVRLVSGLADAQGRAFAPAWNRAGSATPAEAPGTRIYNQTFRTVEQEPASSIGAGTRARWNNTAQSTALTAGDAAPFSAVIDWTKLAAAIETPEPIQEGYSQRWFVSALDLGQGLLPTTRTGTGPPPSTVQVFGRVQPYTIYLPTGFDPTQAYPLTILLHGGDGNHNSFLGANRARVHGPVCDQRQAICISPFGRGGSTWFVNEGEVDVWEAWRATAAGFKLRPEETLIGGFSMGATGASRFMTNFPDVFAASFVAAGAGYMDSNLVRDRADDPLRAENFWNLPVVFMTGTTDVARNATLNWETFLRPAGVRFRTQVTTSTPNGHGDIGTGIGWDELLPYYGGFPAQRVRNPGRVLFRFAPNDAGRADYGTQVDSAYWIHGMSAREPAARWSRVDARTHARPEPAVTPAYSDTTGPQRSTTARVMTQAWIPGAVPAARNAMTLTLTNLATLTVDLQRAALNDATPIVLQVGSDGPTQLSFTGTTGNAAAVGGGRITLSGPGGLTVPVDGTSGTLIVAGTPYAALLSAAQGALDRGPKVSACAQLRALGKVIEARRHKGLSAETVDLFVGEVDRVAVAAGC